MYQPTSNTVLCFHLLLLCPVARLCSLNRNDGLCLRINEDTIRAPYPTRHSTLSLLLPSASCVPSHFLSHFLYFPLPVSPLTDSDCLLSARSPVISISLTLTATIGLSRTNPPSSIHILSACVCNTGLVYGVMMGTQASFLFNATAHEGNKHYCLSLDHMSNVYYSRKLRAIMLADETES